MISLLSPRGSMEKTLRAVIGIFVVSAICTPLVNLKKADSFLPAFMAEASPVIDTENLQEQMENACKNTVGKVVDEAMTSAGIDNYDVSVNVYTDNEYCINIQEIQITIAAENSSSVERIQAVLQEKLCVPVNVICE